MQRVSGIAAPRAEAEAVVAIRMGATRPGSAERGHLVRVASALPRPGSLAGTVARAGTARRGLFRSLRDPGPGPLDAELP